MTGITALLAMLPALYFYRRDRVRRVFGGLVPEQNRVKLSKKEGLLLLAVGAGLAQYGNILVGFLQQIFQWTAYQESMERITEGQNFLALLFWMGIVAPIAEEMIFRWLVYLRLRDYMRIVGATVISGLFFGLYHGNIVQAIYASLLGAVFAYILEVTGSLWSCVLLHIGANVWSLILSEFGQVLLESSHGIQILMLMYMVLLAVMVGGILYFVNKSGRRKYRMN